MLHVVNDKPPISEIKEWLKQHVVIQPQSSQYPTPPAVRTKPLNLQKYSFSFPWPDPPRLSNRYRIVPEFISRNYFFMGPL